MLGRKKNGPQAIGVSRGGLNTKIHAVCDALGNPLRFKLTAGNKSDTPELIGLIQDLPGQELLADKIYDSEPPRVSWRPFGLSQTSTAVA
ncbi:transposase [Simplicispira metamorpha]|uniref:DDE family transposase n=1 Tax=Simplicispira metamorpha TaxID=80881 RepID=A0A4R2N0N0_9BURK|nr:transposase [Simplicispira metamorpha]TCP12946.1 DDE family transposase [Simplicispira metamorpha]